MWQGLEGRDGCCDGYKQTHHTHHSLKISLYIVLGFNVYFLAYFDRLSP